MEAINLKRDCDAVLIPMGTPLKLKAGTDVYITQALGGSYTINVNGNLARIEAKDADALGFEVDDTTDHTKHQNSDGTVDENLIWEQLRTCFDPEIPINIVDLGLIYECDIKKLNDDQNGYQVDVVMTLTAPGCGMGEFLVDDVRSKLSYVPNVLKVNVSLSFDPPWNQDMMSEVARVQTGLFY